MLRVLYTGRTAMNAMQNKLDTISNNLANVNTIGYKKLNTNFSDLVYEKIDRLGVPTNKANSETLLNGTGVKISSVTRDNSQGTMINTGIPTNLMINGEGYFKVTRADNTDAYTRSGDFNVDSDGNLVDVNGDKVETNLTDNTFKFKKDNFTVKEDGTITSKESGREVGKLKVYNALGDGSLLSIGDNLYVPKDNNTVMYENNTSAIVQGYTEGSNVDIAQEMTEMIVTQRAFELSSKALKSGDDMYGIINNLRR
ncbi:MAG: flagellar hook-basal body complex protein [Clostridiaceae bacterium]